MQATRSGDHIKEALGRTTPQFLRSLRARLEDPSPRGFPLSTVSRVTGIGWRRLCAA